MRGLASLLSKKSEELAGVMDARVVVEVSDEIDIRSFAAASLLRTTEAHKGVGLLEDGEGGTGC